MTPKLGTVYDFFIMFEHVLRRLPWQYIVWWSQKWRKKVWRKRILVTQYIDVYTVMYWVYPSIYVWFLYFSFVVAFKLLSIVFKCTDTSPKHSILYFGGKGEKNYVRITNICNPWLYWYILVHTRTYWYILVYTRTYSHILSCTSNQAGFASRWRTVAAARL